MDSITKFTVKLIVIVMAMVFIAASCSEASTNEPSLLNKNVTTNGVLKIKTILEISFEAVPGNYYTLMNAPTPSGPWKTIKMYERVHVSKTNTTFSLIDRAEGFQRFWMLHIDKISKDDLFFLNVQPWRYTPTNIDVVLSDPLPPGGGGGDKFQQMNERRGTKYALLTGSVLY